MIDNSSLRYLELLKYMLTDYHRTDGIDIKPIKPLSSFTNKIARKIDNILRKKGHAIIRMLPYDKEKRIIGKDWSPFAETMVGLKRLENIQHCVLDLIENKIEGDFIEAGVWRGGTTIFMNGILKVSGETQRKVWVADSFEGLPKPNEKEYPVDKGDMHYLRTELAISLERVKNNFAKYNLLDENVKFLKGWFKDILPKAPIEKLSLIRADGDMYESTMDILVNLYHKLSIGGYIIIDDYGAIPNCKKAVHDFREKENIKEEIKPIDWTGVYWKKLR